MARTVADAAAMLEVMSKIDARDPFAWPIPFAMPTDLHDPHLGGLRIAVSPRLGCRAPLVDIEVDALVAGAGPLLEDAGAAVVLADPIWPIDPVLPFQVFWDTSYVETADAFGPDRRRLLDPAILSAAERGRRRHSAELLAAITQRIGLAMKSAEFFTRFDLLVGPVMPVPPYAIDRDVPEGFHDDDWSWCPYTYLWNMLGQPAASVPIGFTQSGLPVGVQLIGRVGDEQTVLRAAAAIERRLPLHLKRPTLDPHRPDAHA
jgi:aspartyl-tRNA(Asn)/glutamyl-tRNA(Gln) amidotransferase subunit A